MKKILPDGRLRIGLSVLGFCLLLGIVLSYSEQASQASALSPNGGELAKMDLSAGGGMWSIVGQAAKAGAKQDTGTLEKMIVADGVATMDVDLNRLNGVGGEARQRVLSFQTEKDAFFTILVFDNELRGPMPSSMGIIPQNNEALPAKLKASYNQLIIERLPFGGHFTLAIRDAKSGFTFFNIEGHELEYQPVGRSFSIKEGRVLISPEFAEAMGRPADAGVIVGSVSVTANMRAIEVAHVTNGEVDSNVLPATEAGTVPGPDVIVGDVVGLQQFGGSSGTQVGLAVGTDSCNAGTVNLNWFRNPDNNHPVIPQNLYRMSGGANNNDRFEQVGQSSVKHAFTALTLNLCGFGCNGVGGNNLGSGCSDPYSADLNSGPSLGSRAWINPFTGFYPRNDSNTPNNSHAGHSHVSPSHRILTEISDLSTTQNPGASYYAEAQYVTPHEYVHCQANPTQCNMNNNVSYRRYNVSGTGSPFSFSEVGSTVRQQAAIRAWTGATVVEIRPDAVNDGLAFLAYKVTNPSPGVWHYEYAIYNQNLDRAIQSFSIPTGSTTTITNVGFHAPPQHPGWAADGTVGNTGFSSAAWGQVQVGNTMTWSSETFAQNPNANAIRWGTMYNVRFDSNRPPVATNVTVGFLKTGSPIAVAAQGPNATQLCFQTAVSRRCPGT